MNDKTSITALMSAFGRAFYTENEHNPIFADSKAKELMTDEEYVSISKYILGGMDFFAPDKKGTFESTEEAQYFEGRESNMTAFEHINYVTPYAAQTRLIRAMELDYRKYGKTGINYTEDMLETDIENELVRNVTSLLMELGKGFAFMGQQYHLEVGGKDFYIDLLFYNTKLRCYVAIDLKTGEFKPEQAGKMNFYLSALDDLVKSPDDNPSVGLILCRDENRTIAEYALRDMSKPIGVSEYHLCTDLPLNLKNILPDVDEIRSRIDMKK